MTLQEEVFRTYKQEIETHKEENRAGANALKDNMFRSPLYFKDRYTSKTLQIPKVYSKETVEAFISICSMTHRIFEKVIREYLTHEDFRALFPFSKELEELILTPIGYEALLPMARFDIFYHEDTGEFYFCEINTDGTSAMIEDYYQGKLILDNPAHQAVIRKYRLSQFELFDSWVNTFLQLYSTYERKVERPNIAIIDFLDQGTYREFQEFCYRFQQAGCFAEICDIRSLSYRDGALYSDRGNRIDAIYRRAVTSDIMKHTLETAPLLRAVKEQKVFMAGSFTSQIIHNKWLFHILRLDRTKRILSDEENAFVEAHIPMTGRLGEDFPIDRVLENKDAYILKPLDSYGSNGIYAGVECSQEDWENAVKSLPKEEYLCQKYCPQYKTENIDFAWGDGEWHSYLNMAGLYVYNGVFAGVFSRQAEGNGIIASHRNERTVPTFVVSEAY